MDDDMADVVMNVLMTWLTWMMTWLTWMMTWLT